MQEFSLALLRKIGPEQIDEISRRVMLLERIDAREPIGRRSVAALLNFSEREVRSAAEALKAQGLISLSTSGMTLTRAGKEIMPEARILCRLVTGLGGLERELSERLGLKKVTVVPGDASQNGNVLREVGRAAAHRLRQMVQAHTIIAIAGGSTMAELARGMVPCAQGVMVVPARGGMGSAAATQADTVAGDLALHMNAECRLIHIPDGINMNAMNELLKLPDVRETLELMRKADLIVCGIGTAAEMAQRRGLDAAQTEALINLGAVGESLGDFFDNEGRTVYQSPSVSTELRTQRSGSRMLAAAAGSNKAKAILAAVRHKAPDSLILDEGAARSIIDLLPPLD